MYRAVCHGDRLALLPRFDRGINDHSAVGVDDDIGTLIRSEPGVDDFQRVAANWKYRKSVLAIRAGLDCALKSGPRIYNGDGRRVEDSSARVSYCSFNSTRRGSKGNVAKTTQDDRCGFPGGGSSPNQKQEPIYRTKEILY